MHHRPDIEKRLEPQSLSYEIPSPAEARKTYQRRFVQMVAWGFALAFLAVVAWIVVYVVIPFTAQQRRITAKERQLLYQTDPQKLLAACREMQDKKVSTGNPNNPQVPALIRSLKPQWVSVDDIVHIEFGGGFFHYGITAFKPGVKGGGTKEIIPGLWFDAEDGNVPSR